ncbi:SDR family oxidoreductase [Parafrankia sp. EUN1f]|uniref:SDR family NAD(P)-dependent oxidoreductase n=1 Tax=Parafrankia sp. EUN1f TaxID=102897 RepID=UPI0001C43962|nr:SDR family NAD(P)-dependent oxidoreductase [Parafrankia sp. EUN1f]EFC85905.1 short-chain dehydrogenase/reductase SDR [Parafrankia sp. EUN1f]
MGGHAFRLRRLRTDTELAAFTAHYARYSGYSVEIEYLRSARVFATFDGPDLVGGFVLNVTPPFRTLTRIPQPARARCEMEIDETDTQEFTCAWLAPPLRRSWRSLLFWCHVLHQGGKVGRHSVIMGTEVPALRDFYHHSRPRPLYVGPVVVDGVEKTGWVYQTTLEKRYFGILRIVRHRLGRALRERLGLPARRPGPRTEGRMPVRMRVRAPFRTSAAGKAVLAQAADGGWALVTGASSGIGRAYAEALATLGVDLILTSDDAENLVRVAAALRAEHGVRAVAHPLDLADPSFVDKLPGLVDGRRVDVLVNSAGIGIKGLFTAADAAAYTDLVHLNMLAPVLLTRAVLPSMLGRGRGAVIHIASVNALAPIGHSAVYSAGKAFLLSYATAVWHENRDSGVLFQTVLPGTTATPFQARSGSTRLPPWTLTPEVVAAGSLATLGRDLVHVPGLINRAYRAIGAVLPLRTKTATATAVMRRSLGV